MRVLVLVSALLLSLATSAWAGGAMHERAAARAFETLGVRAVTAAWTAVRVGEEAEVEVVAPGRLRGFGLAGVKPGDFVKVKVIEEDDLYELTLGETSVRVRVDKQGAVKHVK